MFFSIRFIQAVTGFLFLISAISGCAQNNRNTADTTGKSTTVPDSLQIILGEGGGFTGRWQGYTIHSNGSVDFWSGRFLEDRVDSTLILFSASETAALWREIEASNFFEDSLQQTGEYSAILKIITPQKNHSVTWIPRVESLEEIQHSTERLYLSIKQQIKNH